MSTVLASPKMAQKGRTKKPNEQKKNLKLTEIVIKLFQRPKS